MGASLPNLKGRFLEGASGTVGQFKSAGLPNITGTFVSWVSAYVAVSSSTNDISGAFYEDGTGRSWDERDGGNASTRLVRFKASKSSSIYGNSTTVQPKSYTVNYIIKAY